MDAEHHLVESAKIAIATDGDEVAAHFGRCEAYTIAELVDGAICRQQVIPNPGHEPGFLPNYLAERGVTCMIAGGMGPRAQMLFDEHGIETIVGVVGKVEGVIVALLRGELRSGESLCEH